MVLLPDLAAFLNDFMGYDDNVLKIDPYLANGLQVEGRPEIYKIATGVSASLRWFELAVAADANALLVHHSLNPPAQVHLDRIFTMRLRYLWERGLSLIGYHFLLDSHPTVGHNACILRRLGAEPIEPYGRDGWGWLGEIPGGADRDALLATCAAMFGQAGRQYPFGPEMVRRVVALSGSGAPRPSDYDWLLRHNVDFYVSGEAEEWSRELCREAGISMVAPGHYNSEIIGLQALAKVILGEFEVEVEFVDLPNDV